MKIILLRYVSAAIAALSLVIAALAAPTSASAQSPCHAYGWLPTKLKVNQDDEIIHSSLHPTGGCAGYEMDGATAYLDGPDGNQDFLFSDAFYTSERVDLYAWEI